MFKVLRCPKCDHVITGQDEFVENVMQRYDDNLRKLTYARGAKNQQLLQENAMLKSYLKQVIHYRSEIDRATCKATYFNRILIQYMSDNGLITKEKMDELGELATERMNKSLEKHSKELERIYGDYNSIFNNAIKSDPTLAAVMRKG